MVNVKLSTLPAEQRISAARAVARSKMPYFGNGITNLVPRPVAGFGEIGVTKQSILMYDPELLGKWTVAEAGTVILHEYMHIYLRHHARFMEMIRKGMATLADARVWNHAGDMEINDNLVEAHLSLPGNPILPSTYGLPVHRTAEEYFIALKKDDLVPPPSSGQGFQWGECGSGAGGVPFPDEPDNDPDGRTPIEQEVQRRSDSAAIMQHAKNRGTVPGGLSRHAGADLEEPQISWGEQLAHRIGRAVLRKMGEFDYTPMVRARMQSGLDFVYGEESPVLLGMDAPTVNVALILDDSGSMGNGEIEVVLAEAEGIIRAQGGAKLSVIVCDAAAHSVAEVRSAAEIGAHMLNGGGGTDFRPAFEALDKLKPRPDIVVFGTDGYGAYPDEPPKGMDVIWLEVNGQIGVDWGEVIKLDLKPEEDDDDAAA